MRIIIVVVALVASTTTAFAKCPLGTSYQCTQGMSGKVICGCR